MAERVEVPVITLGGKGSSLSSSSVYAIANGLAHVRIDSSALGRLSSFDNRAPSVKAHQFNFSNFLTTEESKASLAVLLNKLVILSGSHSVRSILPVRIVEALNSTSLQKPEIDSIDLTEEEATALEILGLTSALYGVFALLDHQTAALSTIVDVVAAISCEASKTDVAAFNLMDSGDGHTAKDEIGVAGDMKVLLNGSKLVGKVESEVVSKIPKIHGCLREQSKLVHSKTRVELNSGVKVGKGGHGSAGAAGMVRTALLPLAAALWDLGTCSFSRTKLNLDSVSSDELRSCLVGLFEKQCPSADSLRNEFKVVSELVFEGEDKYDKFAHQVNVLVGLVWKIVAWEAIAAYVALEGAELNEKSKTSEVNGGENAKVDKKSEKKKKVVLGKGTSVMIQLIKSRLASKADAFGSSGLLDKWVEDLLSFLDPKDLEFDGLLNKVKEIVESNETRRLPKLPKVIT